MNNEKKDCCGCSACQNICPRKAITMIEDEEGFLYPVINKEKCINCNLCKKVCPLINNQARKLKNENYKVYAVKHKIESIRENSTSGGMFTAITDYILENNGIVYGALYTENFKVVHKRITTKKERDKMRGSKYVQSEINETYSQVKNDLKNNKLVIFTGTPCQIAGLKSLLSISKINLENLILCDIVCHGVPSPKLFQEHIKRVQDKYGNFKNYNFRDKSINWHGSNVSIILKINNQIKNTHLLKSYSELYFDSLISRPSCHSCQYTDIKRTSDITIGDFWGIEKIMSEFDDNKGINLVLINSEKGMDLFDKIKNKVDYKESDTTNCLQPQLRYPTPVNKKRNIFWKEYQKKGYDYIIKKYTCMGLKKRTKQKIKTFIIKLIPKNIKNNIKKIIYETKN